MKQTTEFLTAFGMTINAGVNAAADGKLNFADMGQLIVVFPAWQTAINDLEINTELQVATDADLASGIGAFKSQLTQLDPSDATDAANMLSGVLSAWRIIARKNFQKGLEEGQKLATPVTS